MGRGSIGIHVGPVAGGSRASPSGQVIVLIEDSDQDREAAVRTLRASRLRNPIVAFADGDQALAYLALHARGGPAAPAPPGLVLLDLNLPGTDGREVLARIRAQPSLAAVPVVVITGSQDPRDHDACLAAGADGFVGKPLTLARFVDALARLPAHGLELLLTPAAERGQVPC